jgi:GT2 family glycosyltransferase
MKKTAILLTTFNRKTITLKCIDSIIRNLDYDKTKFDIYITDSNSSDGTIDAINELNYNINIFNIGEDKYWAQGMNLAWEIAKAKNDYDFYILLNDDTILFKNALAIIFDDYKKCKEESILVGVTKKLKQITYGGRLNSIKDDPLKPNGEIQEVKYINGNFVLIPKKVISKTGFLNKYYSHSLADIDFGLRCLKKEVGVYITSDFIGECEPNEKKILEKGENILTRFNRINSIKNLPFREYFYFNLIHFGIFKSIKFTIGYIILILFPRIYKLYKVKYG